MSDPNSGLFADDGTGRSPSGAGQLANQTADDLGAPRTRKPQRHQSQWLACSLDELIAEDHPARIIWQVVQSLDLRRFYEPIKAREGSAGREPADPPLMIALWLLAAVDGVASGRRLEVLCTEHLAYRWLCGGVSVNYHSLNDFRVGHRQALDELFTQVLGHLMHQGLLQVQRITQDGTKVRASAGSGSFQGSDSLQQKLAEARAHVAELSRLADESPSESATRQRAAQERAALDRARRVAAATEQLQQIEAAKQQQKDKPSKHRPARASTTDPEARMQKMSDGGFRPAYNLQFAEDPQSRAIVGVAVAEGSSDKDQAEPMRQQVQQRTGQQVEQQLVDGNYVSLEQIDQATAAGVTVYAPVPEPRKEGQDRFAPRSTDSEAVAQWRARMGTAEAQAIYQQRASTCETVHGDLKTYRGLGRLLVRGSAKVLCIGLWAALAYNVMHFAVELTRAATMSV